MDTARGATIENMGYAGELCHPERAYDRTSHARGITLVCSRPAISNPILCPSSLSWSFVVAVSSDGIAS